MLQRPRLSGDESEEFIRFVTDAEAQNKRMRDLLTAIMNEIHDHGRVISNPKLLAGTIHLTLKE